MATWRPEKGPLIVINAFLSYRQICLVVPLHEWILMEMVAVSMFGIAGRRDHGVSSFFGGIHFG